MKRVAENILKSNRISVPQSFSPKLILDVGYRTRKSSLEFYGRFPNATILSYQFDNANFLLDGIGLAYHDNIRFKSFNIDSFHLDDFIYGNMARDAEVDFINLDVFGKEKEIFKYSGIWPENTKYIRAKLGSNYDYQEAKSDLKKLGFTAYAMYDNVAFIVVGERNET